VSESILVVTVQDRTRLRGKIGQKRVAIGMDARTDLGPMGGGDGRAAVVAFSVRGLQVETAPSVIVERLSQAAGMRRRCGDGQSHRGEGSHQQKS
jgi:hypothetical protein